MITPEDKELADALTAKLAALNQSLRELDRNLVIIHAAVRDIVNEVNNLNPIITKASPESETFTLPFAVNLEWYECPICGNKVALHPADSLFGCAREGCGNFDHALRPCELPAPSKP